MLHLQLVVVLRLSTDLKQKQEKRKNNMDLFTIPLPSSSVRSSEEKKNIATSEALVGSVRLNLMLVLKHTACIYHTNYYTFLHSI